MKSALIVTASKKSMAYFSDMLEPLHLDQAVTVNLSAKAPPLLHKQEFDLVIINAPMGDESSEALARSITQTSTAQAIIILPLERFKTASPGLEAEGVFVLARPINRAAFSGALQLAQAARNRLVRVEKENALLRKTIEDIRIVDKAKCLLIAKGHMGEGEAHRYIEKQAMDKRASKRAVAGEILMIYGRGENTYD